MCDKLLEKCMHGKTQNANEALNGIIWSRVPKTIFVGRESIEMGTYSAVIHYNDGRKGILKVLVDGQWGLWSGWSHVSNQNGVGYSKKRTRQCGVFPPTVNSGVDNCPGGSIEVKPCYECYINALKMLGTRSQKPSTATTYTGGLEFNFLSLPTHDIQFSTTSSVADDRPDNVLASVLIQSSSSISSATGFEGEDEAKRRNFTLLPYRMISSTKTFSTIAESSSTCKISYDMNYKLTDNPSQLKPFITNIIMTKLEFEARYFAVQLITERLPPDPGATADFDTIVQLTSPPSSLILSSAQPTVTIQLKPSKKDISATSLSITLEAPISIDIETAIVSGTIGSKVMNKEQRTLTWHMPYLEASAEYMEIKFTFRIATDEMDDFAIKIPITISFCPKHVCSSSEPKQNKTNAIKLMNIPGHENFQLYSQEAVEKIHDLVISPFTLNSYTKVANDVTTLPAEHDNTKMYFKRTGDELFKPGDIIVWERFGPPIDTSAIHTITFYKNYLEESIVKMSAFIKFIDNIPNDKISFEMTGTEPITLQLQQKCQANVWCKVKMELYTQHCGSSCVLKFNLEGITEAPQIIYFGGVSINNREGEIHSLVISPYVVNSERFFAMGNLTTTLPITHHSCNVSYVEDSELHPGGILKFEKTESTGMFKWIGLKIEEWSNRFIALRIKIKFINFVPTPAPNTGIKIMGNLHNSWLNKCSVNKWCEAYIKDRTQIDPANSYFIFIVDDVNGPLIYHLAHFSVTKISTQYTCINPTRGYRDTGATASLRSPNYLTYQSCVSYCHSNGYSQMTWFTNPSTTSEYCTCIDGAGTIPHENALFCNLAINHKVAPMDGQWGLWSSWSHVSNQNGAGYSKKRTRQCAVFPPTVNSGVDNCPGGSIEVEPCYECYINALKIFGSRSQRPSTATTYTGGLELNFLSLPTHDIQFSTSSSVFDARPDNALASVVIQSSSSISSSTGFDAGGEEKRHQFSLLPYRMISSMKTFSTSAGRSSTCKISYDVKYRLTDNKSPLPSYITNVIMTKLQYEERYFVVQLLTERLPKDPNATADFDTVVQLTSPSSSPILPSAQPTITVQLKPTKREISATSLSITLHAPISIDIEAANVSGTIGSKVMNKEQRTLTWHMPYLEALAEYMEIKFTVKFTRFASDQSIYQKDDFAIKIPITVSFCPTRVCSSSEPKQIKTNAIKLNINGHENFQIHSQGLDGTRNLIYRGLMKVNTGSYEAIVITNPAGDFGASTNCYFTTDLGARWKAISSLVTNVDFYIPSTDTMFGRCNYGKTYCKFSFTGISKTPRSHILATSKSEYSITRKRLEAVTTSNIDELDFVRTKPTRSSIDKNIGVSLHGIYKLSGSWKQIFAWAK